jgi:membrane protease YdiL (CAAX protease family)
MTERIKRLTDFQEIILVIVIALGLFIYSSVRGLFIISTGTTGTWTYLVSEYGSISILISELVSLGLIGYILSQRKWTFIDLNLTISFKVFFDAVLLIVITGLISGLVYGLVTSTIVTDPESVSSLKFVPHKNYLIWGVMLVINSIFEEFIYVGYLFKKLERHNRGLFILLSATLRIIIHLYQGLLAIIPHFIMGLIFGTYYSKYRQLTTLIIAHTLMNLLVLWRSS